MAKITAAATVCYALSPIDLIPDFIPVLGYLDDILILPALVSITIKLIPTQIFEQCQKEAAQMCKDEKPKKWYFALPIIIIWLLLLYFLFNTFIIKN